MNLLKLLSKIYRLKKYYQKIITFKIFNYNELSNYLISKTQLQISELLFIYDFLRVLYYNPPSQENTLKILSLLADYALNYQSARGSGH